MQYIEILCILLGIVNGALLPMLPDTKDEKRPLGVILSLSLAFALWTGFLPVLTISPRFLSTLIITLVGFGVGILASQAMKAPKTKPQVAEPATVQIKQTAKAA